uniref:Uncharacterized protein n=1 Tax=Anguilla anguilla TaxID=7936 RepID=A0A0E9SLU6_ANGAN
MIFPGFGLSDETSRCCCHYFLVIDNR